MIYFMNKHLSKIYTLLAVILLVGFLSYNRSTTHLEGEVSVVALYPLTGGLASWGESAQKSSQIAVDEINANGGVNGKKLRMIFEDHKCDPKIALSIYKKYVPTHKVFTSSSCSGTVLTIAPNLVEDDAILLSTVVASTKISNASPQLFRNWTIESNQSKAIADAIKEKGYKKVGVLYEETDYARGLKDALVNLLSPDVTFVSEGFVTGSTDLRTQITKIQNSNVDVLFLSPQTESSAEVMLKQITQLNFKSQMFVNDIILGAANTLLNYGTLLENAKGAQYLIGQSKDLDVMLNKYKSQYSAECAHTSACAVAYDTVYMLAEAISKTDGTSERISDYLASINYGGISGSIDFDEKHDRSSAGYSGVTIKNGQIVYE